MDNTYKESDELDLLYEKDIVFFSKVSYRYPAKSKDSLKRISFRINKGDFIGIVGATGSGKSTILNLLLGLLSPTSGRVFS